MSVHQASDHRFPGIGKRFSILLIFVALSLVSTYPLRAQSPGQQVFVGVSFFQVKPGKSEAFISLIRNTGKKVQEYRFRQKNILGWYLYEVLIPGDMERKYNFVAVTVSGDFNDLVENIYPPKENFMQAIKGANNDQYEKFVTQINDIRLLVKREVYAHRAGIDPNTPVSKYVEIDYMKPLPGKTADYVKAEKDVFLPIHRERIKLGALTDWGLYERILPFNSNADSDYVTANFFDNLKSLIDPKYEEAFNNIPHNVDFAKMTEMVEQLRRMVRSDIWKLVEYVDQANTK